jgi:hypothetical protein
MDVDVVAELTTDRIRPIFATLSDEFYVGEPAMRDAIVRQSSFNLIHLSTSFKVEVFVSRRRRFDESSFARSILSRLGTAEIGIDVPIASVEDTVLAKLE